MFNNSIFNVLLLCLILCGCKNSKPAASDEPATALCGPTFCEDSAYVFCAEQCQFGPRIMNSEAHEQCAGWIINKFKGYGCTVVTQKANLRGWDGTMLASTNIIASINPNIKERYLLCAHWDSRPWADNDMDEKNHHTPVMAANDGASGIAVMLEIARIIGDSIGIDFVCFDAEDYGSPQWSDNHDEKSWALGSQYFAQQYKRSEELPLPDPPEGGRMVNGQSSMVNGQWQAAILLDMVGGQGAHFYQEGLSMRYAPQTVTEVWQAANEAGYGSFFIHEISGTITDDHKPLNEAGIPTIDIIPYYPDCEQSSFGPTWHTVNDDMHHIDKTTLKAVGQTLIQYLCRQN